MVFILFILGLFVGSFLNVLIYRLPRGKPWVGGRSACPHCHATLRWYDLIPVFSWLWLGAKCRDCHKPISLLYPTVELMNGIGWGIIGHLSLAICHSSYVLCHLSGIGQLGWSGLELVYTIAVLFLFSALLVIFWIDIQHYIIPDEVVWMLAGIGIILGLISPAVSPIARFLWGLGSMGFFWTLHQLTKGKGMGFGDVKLALGMGLILGQAVIVALMSAFMIGALVGVWLIAVGRKKFRQPIPFGPFLVVGMLIALVYGDQVIKWYLAGLIF